MTFPFPKRGLYAITQTEGKKSETIINDVHTVLKGGVAVIQYRNKNTQDSIDLANEILTLCKEHQVPLIINDDAKLAQKIGANGVHLGKNDGEIAEARKILGSSAIIGVSCYNDIKLALQATTQGVDYVAFGRFFPSSTKPLASPANIDTLWLAKQKINLPIVAIGGILPENGGQLLSAGADILAVVGGLFDSASTHNTKTYLNLFNK